jgi:hypothetical protein
MWDSWEVGRQYLKQYLKFILLPRAFEFTMDPKDAIRIGYCDCLNLP